MRSKPFYSFLLILLLLAILPLSCTRNKTEKRGVDQINLKDQVILSAFFEILFKHSPGGFTLFGNKPISTFYYVFPEEGASINKRNVFGVLMEEGWNTFQKYPEIFASDRFTLKRTINPADPLPVVYITLINKKAALESIQENIQVFQEEYGSKFIPKDYLDSLEHIAYEKSNLTGILMGYGARSGWAFNRRGKILQFYFDNPEIFQKDKINLLPAASDAIEHFGYARMPHPILNSLSPSVGFSSLTDELNYIFEHYSFFEMEGADYSFTLFGLPEFACLDDDVGIAEIKENYQETLKALRKSYQNRPFLEATLEQWQKE